MGKPAIPAMPGTWWISRDDNGTFGEVQDLTDMIGINLKRDEKKAINGRHCAVEFGFRSLFQDVKASVNIVDPTDVTSDRGDTIKIKSGVFDYTATVHQIAIHRAGAHARILIRKNTIK